MSRFEKIVPTTFLCLMSAMGMFFTVSSFYANERGDYFTPGKNYTMNGHVSSNGINICDAQGHDCHFQKWSSFEYCDVLLSLWYAINVTFVLYLAVCAKITHNLWKKDFRFSIWYIVLHSFSITQLGYFIFFATWYSKCFVYIRDKFSIDIGPNSSVILPFFIGLVPVFLAFFVCIGQYAMKKRHEEIDSDQMEIMQDLHQDVL